MVLKIDFVFAALTSATLLAACEPPSDRAVLRAPDGPAGSAPALQQGVEESPREPAPAPRSSHRAIPPPDALTDTMITARIKAEILSDPAMHGADVSVNTTHGVVSLAGRVQSPEQTAIASAHAQQQDGVMRVDTHLAFNLQ